MCNLHRQVPIEAICRIVLKKRGFKMQTQAFHLSRSKYVYVELSIRNMTYKDARWYMIVAHKSPKCCIILNCHLSILKQEQTLTDHIINNIIQLNLPGGWRNYLIDPRLKSGPLFPYSGWKPVSYIYIEYK